MDGLIRTAALLKQFPLSRSRLSELIADGQFPPPLKIGSGGAAAAAAWFTDEVAAVVRARAAGLDAAALRALVVDMVAIRSRKDAAAQRERIVARHLGEAA